MGRARSGYTPPDPVRTPLVTNTARITFYFRTHLTVGSLAGITSLQMSNIIDDGGVFYLNGVELARTRMPAGTPTFNTLASSIQDAG